MGDGKLKSKKGDVGKHIKPTEDKIGTALNLEHPVFCFKYLNNTHGLDKCSQSEKSNLLHRLHQLSTMTWQQIQLAPKGGLGSEKISYDSIIPGKPPQHIITKDQFFLALRFEGNKPFVGVRNRFIFHIIYIDRDFTVYDHG